MQKSLVMKDLKRMVKSNLQYVQEVLDGKKNKNRLHDDIKPSAAQLASLFKQIDRMLEFTFC